MTIISSAFSPQALFFVTQFIHVQYTQIESIRLRHRGTIRLDSHVTSQLDSHGVASRKSTSGMTNRQQGKRFCISPQGRDSGCGLLRIIIQISYTVRIPIF